MFLWRDSYLYVIFLVILPIVGCTKPSLYIEDCNANNNKKYNICKTGLNISNSLTYNERHYQCQGMAINGNIMYRLFASGICQTYDISDIDRPVLLNVFRLGSNIWSNHCNAAQIIEENGQILIYIAGLDKKCFVESISIDNSKLIQTITLSSEAYPMDFNIICGNDGYLWAFGGMIPTGTVNLLKLRKPNIDEGDVVLYDKDILDAKTLETEYDYYSMWQGGKCYDGKLYFVFGSVTVGKEIGVYDTNSGRRLYRIELNDTVKDEPEDCELIANKMLLTNYGGNGFYIIDNILR